MKRRLLYFYLLFLRAFLVCLMPPALRLYPARALALLSTLMRFN